MYTFRTAHGDFTINDSALSDSATIKDLLIINGIPSNSVAVYGVSHSHQELQLIVDSDATLSALEQNYKDIIIRPDRNINYKAIIGQPVINNYSDNSVTNYNFAIHEKNGSSGSLVHKEFSIAECRDFVAESISRFLDKVSIQNDKAIVVGVSGGGDSNTLIHSLAADKRIRKEQIKPVMMLGIPDWDKGLTRAMNICKSAGLELIVINNEEVNVILGRSHGRSYVEDFESFYPGVDLEILGTLAIRLVLSHVSKKLDAQAIITGLNLEDLLSECLLSCINGRPPLPFPIRKIDGINVWYPLYKVPKRILDGCNPRYSLQNYEERLPSYSYWRAYVYNVAQQMSLIVPGLEFLLLDGFMNQSVKAQRELHFDEDIGFSLVDEIMPDNRVRWKTFINYGRS